DEQPPLYKPGDEVVVIHEAELRVPAGRTDNVWPGLVLKVTVVNEKWLWVSNGKPGWLYSDHVVPLDRQAIDRISVLVQDDPANPRLISGRATVWLNLGDLDSALADCDEAIRLAPQSAEYY